MSALPASYSPAQWCCFLAEDLGALVQGHWDGIEEAHLAGTMLGSAWLDSSLSSQGRNTCCRMCRRCNGYSAASLGHPKGQRVEGGIVLSLGLLGTCTVVEYY